MVFDYWKLKVTNYWKRPVANYLITEKTPSNNLLVPWKRKVLTNYLITENAQWQSIW